MTSVFVCIVFIIVFIYSASCEPGPGGVPGPQPKKGPYRHGGLFLTKNTEISENFRLPDCWKSAQKSPKLGRTSIDMHLGCTGAAPDTTFTGAHKLTRRPSCAPVACCERLLKIIVPLGGNRCFISVFYFSVSPGPLLFSCL